MQISFVMLLFSDQISRTGKSFQGGKLPQGGARPEEESQLLIMSICLWSLKFRLRIFLILCFGNKPLKRLFVLFVRVSSHLADLFLYSYENECLDKVIKEGKRKLARSSISHIVILMTLSLSVIKDLMNSSLASTPKNSPFLRLQNLLQLLFISTSFYQR